MASRESRLWVVAVFAGVFAAVLAFWGRVLYSDTYTGLTAGRLIFEHGLPLRDTLTVAAQGRPWVDQQWLAHLTMYGAWRLGGYPLLGIISAVAAAGALTLLFSVLRFLGASSVWAFGVTGGCFVAADLNFQTRAQTFAYPLFVLLLAVLVHERHQSGIRVRLLAVWPLLLLWGNVHGSVLLGDAVCLLFGGIEIARHARSHDFSLVARYAGFVGGACCCSLITPYGATLLSYYPNLLGNPNLQSIAEWQPATFSGVSVPFIAWALITFGYACFAWGRGVRASAFLLILTAGLALMGTQAIRYQVWFVLAAALLIAEIRSKLAPSGPHSRTVSSPLLPTMAAGVAAVAALATTFVVISTPTAYLERLTPPKAMEVTARTAARPGTRILTDDLTGSALTWAYPSLAGEVAFDSRTEIFPRTQFTELARFLTLSNGWESVTRRYSEISVSCIGRVDLCQALRGLHGWRIELASPQAFVARKMP
jgi:hypothetical protein